MSLTFEAIYLEGEGITKKSNPWKTTSFGRSFMGNQHCNGQCNHLGGPASFIRKRLQKYDIDNLDVISVNNRAIDASIKCYNVLQRIA